ncbi:MAG: heavy-metal-associated domain-containing protein [Xylophilus ampelinus]
MSQAFQVEGMSCGHCQQVVTQAIHAIDPQAQVTVSLDNGHVDVVSQREPEAIALAIENAGYRARALR